VNNLTPSAFWFNICSNYFPFCSNEFLDKDNYTYIEEHLNKFMDKMINTKQMTKSKKDFGLNFRSFIADMASTIDSKVFTPVELSKTSEGNENILIQNQDLPENEEIENTPGIKYKLDFPNNKKQTSIDQMILKLTGYISDVSTRVKYNLNELKNNMKANKGNLICTDYKVYDPDCYNKNNLNLDMQYISLSKNKFFKYLNQRHDENLTNGNKKIYSKFEEEQSNIHADDIVCTICNDGDYEDNDLIVFCSVII